MVKTAPGRKKHTKTRKSSKASIMRLYGVPVTAWMRYKNPIEKGIYWYLFSKAVRMRDCFKYGVCISCGRRIKVDTCDAGHFIPAGDCGPELLFDPRNVNAECFHCNAWDGLHLFGYARGLDSRYGEGTAEELLRRHREHKNTKPAPKDFTRKEYVAKILELQRNGI